MPASTSSILQKCILAPPSYSSPLYDVYTFHYHRIPFSSLCLFVLYMHPVHRYPVPQLSETQGRSEEYLGHWIRSRKITRDRIVLATKVCLCLCCPYHYISAIWPKLHRQLILFIYQLLLFVVVVVVCFVIGSNYGFSFCNHPLVNVKGIEIVSYWALHGVSFPFSFFCYYTTNSVEISLASSALVIS